jgi:hypothetical protein
MIMDEKENVTLNGEGEEVEARQAAQSVAQDTVQNDREKGTLLGKFKDVDALLQAYNSLQAEFTRRSQRLKELENLVDRNTLNSEKGVPMSEVKASEREERPADSAEKERIIAEYLREVKESAVPLLRGGVGVASPRKGARSIAEAGQLALGFLKSQK